MPIVKKQLGEFVSGDYLKDNNITFLKIQTIPRLVTSTYGEKLECSVSYEGIGQGKPFKWGMNKKSRNTLIEKYGEDTDTWLGKVIPVETAPTEKGRAIYVDVKVLGSTS